MPWLDLFGQDLGDVLHPPAGKVLDLLGQETPAMAIVVSGGVVRTRGKRRSSPTLRETS